MLFHNFVLYWPYDIVVKLAAHITTICVKNTPAIYEKPKYIHKLDS